GFTACTLGEIANPRHLGAIGGDDVIRLAVAGQLQGSLRTVDDDHGRCGQRLERLDADMAEAAGTDQHRAGSRVQDGHGLLDGVVGGQPGIGKRGNVLGSDAWIDLDHGAGARLEELGEAAIGVYPGERPRAQCTSSPARQALHNPRVISRWTITTSPTSTLSTADPTALWE